MAAEATAVHGHGGGHHAEPAGIDRGLAGMALFIASEVMLFGGLFACYFYLRNQADTWPPADVEHHLSVGTAAILSVFLLSSSVTAHASYIGLKTGNRALFQGAMLLTLVLGGIFIGGQIYEWLTLMDEGLTAGSNVYGSTFYLITGFHGSHVIAGLLMLIVAFARGSWGDFTPTRHIYPEAAVLYWHFVDFIWIFVFLIVYVSAS